MGYKIKKTNILFKKLKNNILIFRTDRIGDLLLTCPTIKTIKDNVPNSNIILVCSSFNYEYAKSFEFIDEVLIFPKKGMLNKIKFIMKLKKEIMSMYL